VCVCVCVCERERLSLRTSCTSRSMFLAIVEEVEDASIAACFDVEVHLILLKSQHADFRLDYAGCIPERAWGYVIHGQGIDTSKPEPLDHGVRMLQKQALSADSMSCKALLLQVMMRPDCWSLPWHGPNQIHRASTTSYAHRSFQFMLIMIMRRTGSFVGTLNARNTRIGLLIGKSVHMRACLWFMYACVLLLCACVVWMDKLVWGCTVKAWSFGKLGNVLKVPSSQHFPLFNSTCVCPVRPRARACQRMHDFPALSCCPFLLPLLHCMQPFLFALFGCPFFSTPKRLKWLSHRSWESCLMVGLVCLQVLLGGVWTKAGRD